MARNTGIQARAPTTDFRALLFSAADRPYFVQPAAHRCGAREEC
jgi:hypothetical protein